MRNIQLSLALVMAALMAVPPAALAESSIDRITGTPQTESWHSRFSNPYTTPEVGPIDLANSTRLDALLRAGRIYLSLQDAIALALENNLDIAVQRYVPLIAESELLRTKAGGQVRGVPTNITTGPSSASTLAGTGVATTGTGVAGSGDTGTSAATGGATVLFSGTQIPSYDESIYVTYSAGHRTQPQANTLLTGTTALINDTRFFNAGIQRGFSTGATIQLGYQQQLFENNSLRSNFNPYRQGNLGLDFRQPLLRGFGIAVNTRLIRVAENEIKQADLTFKRQVIATVAAVANLYSDLVSFSEDVKVKKQALSLAEKLYNDNKKQVEIGTLAPIEIVRAEAEVARAQEELTQSETQLLQQETILKNYISRTGVNSPILADARIVPTDQLRMPQTEPVQPIQDLVQMAVEQRPELEQTRLSIENSRISLKGSKSLLLPQLDLVASATNNGLAGSLNPLFGTGVSPGDPLTPQTDPGLIGGLGSVWNQLLSRNYPDYSIGFQLSIPLRNRQARADVIRDQLSLRQNELRQRQELNQIRVDVQNALIALQQSRSRYQAAEKSRILQEQTLDAEQKKYALGASTIFFVIQAQRDLAQAQASEVAALSQYNRARTSLDRATGFILTRFDISVEEARQGRVQRAPDAIPEVPQQPQQ